MDITSWLILILSTLITFGLFSVLTGIDNPFFAWAEHTYVGAAIGLAVTMTTNYLMLNVVAKIVANPAANWPLIISLILGLMMLTRIHPKYSYIARIPVAVATGTGVAIATRANIFSSIVNQIRATVLPVIGGDPSKLFTNIMVVIFVFTMITYFVYTTEVKGPLKMSNNLGRYMLYAAFGALFAITYMGRLGLLLGRMETMLIPETNMYVSIIIAAIIVVTTFTLHKYRPETLKRIVPS